MANDLEQRLREAAAYDRLAERNDSTPKSGNEGFWKGVVIGIVATLVIVWALNAYQMYQLEQALNSYFEAY